MYPDLRRVRLLKKILNTIDSRSQKFRERFFILKFGKNYTVWHFHN